MSPCFDVIAFDADDTLWHNETFYRQGKERLVGLLSGYVDPDLAGRTLDEIETANVAFYGYGIKSFALSMVETAVKLSAGQVSGDVILEVIAYVKQMLASDPQHFHGAHPVLKALAESYNLMLITKGDLFEQQHKIARSGLSSYFRYIEVVSDKTVDVYRSLLAKYAIQAPRFLMVGNSLRSDILPVVEIGGQAVYIPYDQTWEHEKVLERPLGNHEYHELADIRQLPALIAQLQQGCGGTGQPGA